MCKIFINLIKGALHDDACRFERFILSLRLSFDGYWQTDDILYAVLSERLGTGESENCGATAHRPAVLARPPDACIEGGQLHNADELKGAVAVVIRGGCDFVAKARVSAMQGSRTVLLVFCGAQMLLCLYGAVSTTCH